MNYQQSGQRSFATSWSYGGAATDSKLASDAPDVLPLLSRNVLEVTLRRLPTQAIQRTLRHGVVPVDWRPDCLLYATCGSKGTDYAKHHGLPVVARITHSDFHWAVRHVWGGKILSQATHGLFATYPQFSARRRVTVNQMVMFLILVICLGVSLAFLSAGVVWAAASAVIGLFFLSMVALRLFCLFPLRPSNDRTIKNLSYAELPVYSVLVPVFRETSVLKQLLRALLQLNYPALCIKRTKIISQS